jgi:hypothetical protein
MMLQFREWLFVENTVSQMLKSNPDQPTVANLQTEVRSYLKRFGWARTIPDPQLDPLVKLVTYWLLLMHTASKKTAAAPDSTVKHEDMWTQDMIQLWIRTLTNDYADYLATILTEQPQIARSKFNNPQYKPDNLKADSVAWHEKIATQKRKVADPGRRVDLPGMPAGYYWVSLDRASCDKEAEAMGERKQRVGCSPEKSLGREYGFTDPDGTETLPSFDCLAACPCGASTLAPSGGVAPRCAACGEGMRWCCAVALLDEQSSAAGMHSAGSKAPPGSTNAIASIGYGSGTIHQAFRHGDIANGSAASRFYPCFTYMAKPATSERDAGLDAFLWRRAPRHPFGFERISQATFDALPPALVSSYG